MIHKIRALVANINFRKVLPDYFLLSIGAVILAVNFDIFLAPFNIAPGGISGMALYAFVTLFMWGLVADYVLEGPSVVRTAFIVTDSPEEVSRVLLDRMSVGVTGWAGRGMFSKKEHTTLFCTVTRPDVNILKSLVNAADPRAFVVIVQGQQAKGGTLRQTLRHLNRLQE